MITNFTKDQHAQAIADYLPNGQTFEAKNITDSNLRDFINGLACEMLTSQGYLVTLENDYFPDRTTLFIGEWEKALGIPDDCFRATGTQAERQRDILVKLSSLGIQTEQDFIDLAALFGVTVTMDTGASGYTIIVNFVAATDEVFPYTFPFTFGSNEIVILECLFNKLKPANCEVQFVQI